MKDIELKAREMHDIETFDYSQGLFISGYEAQEFTCFCCGIFCRKYYIRISLDEALGIAAGLDVSWDEWLEKYADPVHSGSEHFVLRCVDEACVFLKHDNLLSIDVCSIHAFKLTVCQDWISSLNQPDCREGLSRFWEININARGELKGSPKNSSVSLPSSSHYQTKGQGVFFSQSL